jgi:imidazolonepropionase-like amidohydrolase
MDLLQDVPHIRFVDAHVHLKNNNAFDQIKESGIGAVRNAGMRNNVVQCYELPNRYDGSPVVISAKWGLYKKEGYGSQFGVPVQSREDIKAEIFKLKAAGANIVKVMASGMVSLERKDTVTSVGFSEEDLSFIVEESAKYGLQVMAHANGKSAIIAAARAGVRSIEHGFFMTEDALEALARAGAFWVPTVSALERASRVRSLTQEVNDYIHSVIEAHLNMIRAAHRMGVGLAIGTDCILPMADYKSAYEAELRFFIEAGLTRDAVMKIASKDGAKLLGIG